MISSVAKITGSFFERSTEQYSQTVYSKCRALENVVAFIDGSVLGVALPGGKDSNQRTLYNVHKRKHELKFKAITTPDRLCVHMYVLELVGIMKCFCTRGST